MNLGVSLRPLVLGLVLVACSLGRWGNAESQPASQKQDQVAPTASPQELFKRLAPSVFVVETLDEKGSVVATGSGVALAPDLVVTNKHVIEDGVAWRIRQGSKAWPAMLSHLDADHDLCGLKAEGVRAAPVPVRASSTLSVGERVYAIGAPEGLELTLSEGLISGLRDYENGHVVQTSAAISPGSSGGGLFDVQGRLVGVTTFFLKEGQSLNFALPGEWVQALTSHSVSPDHKARTDSPAFQAFQWAEYADRADDAGEYEKAVRGYRQAVRLKPDSAPLWSLLGIAYRQLHQYDQAVEALQEAIRLKPDDAGRWALLGASYVELRQHDQAVKAYQEAIRLKPDDAGAWCNLGLACLELGRYDQAVKAYREAIRIEPEHVEAWGRLGAAYEMSGQLGEGIKACQEAVRLNGNDAWAWYWLGQAYFGLGRYDQAVRALQEAVRLEPNVASDWGALGLAYVRQGNRAGVMQVYQELKALDPNAADDFFRKYVLP
jgi:tetratricopeptide (TPR) repeat protein